MLTPTDHLEVWYGQRCVEDIPRLHGNYKHYVQYRHIIDWLIRKPGAFENYRYRSDLFPTSRFRIAYDSLYKCHTPAKASKEYLRILQLAAHENETGVDDCLRYLMNNEELITADNVEETFHSGKEPEVVTNVIIDKICLNDYDRLLVGMEVSS